MGRCLEGQGSAQSGIAVPRCSINAGTFFLHRCTFCSEGQAQQTNPQSLEKIKQGQPEGAGVDHRVLHFVGKSSVGFFSKVVTSSKKEGSAPQSENMAPPGKVFNDPIHGHMEFDHILVKIIDTPQFQRMRNIKQLGGGYFVYPGASHNRFEHSLGVAHLAGKLVRSFREKQPKLGITERDVRCVELAGLCHDLGHGPFSHMFDHLIPEMRPELGGWEHEIASVQIFDHIVEKLNDQGFDHIVEKLKDQGFDLVQELKDLDQNKETKDDLVFIKEMIVGPTKGEYEGRGIGKHFLYEIVANKETGIDVDKFDYFARDSYHLGIKSSFDHLRFIRFARVIEVDGKRRICLRDKEQSNIYEMFHTRVRLHQKAYQHKTDKIIELMITEAMRSAMEGNEDLREKWIPIEKTVDGFKVDVEKYIKLTDNIFEEILHSDMEVATILQKIYSRNLYTHLGKIKNPADLDPEEMKRKLAENAATDKIELTEEDFVHIISKFDFGKKDKNPVENLYFYNKFDVNKAFKIPSDEVSDFLLPKNFLEEWIHIYCKSSDKGKQEIARGRFEKLKEEENMKRRRIN